MAGINGEGMVVRNDRVIIFPQFVQRDAFEDPCFCVIELYRNQPIAGDECLFVSPQLGKGGCLVIPCIGIRGINCQCSIVGDNGVFKFAKVVERLCL